MKKTLFIAFISIMAMPMTMFGQSYKKMWKQLEEADQKDLPQQVIDKAEQIAVKALGDKEWGHLLKARLTIANVQVSIAPDSLQPVVSRMEQELRGATDERLRAVYATVLSRIYDQNDWRLGNTAGERQKEYRAMALANPVLLAQTKARTFDPLVVHGDGSRCFGDDLLSLISRTLDDYEVAHRHYVSAGNRPAACLTALWQLRKDRPYGEWKQSPYVQQIDSLIREYGDLDVAAELALERYDYMDNHGRATQAECYAYIHEAVGRWPKWPAMNVLRNAELEMTCPKFYVRMEHELLGSTQQQEVELDDLRNLSELTLRISKTDLTGDEEASVTSDQDFAKLKNRLTPLPQLTQQRRYSGHEPYEEFSDTMTIGNLPAGIYVLEFTGQPYRFKNGKPMVLRRLLHVSDLTVISEAQPGDKMRFVVVNSQTGQPVGGATLKSWDRTKKIWKTYRCNEKGELLYDAKAEGDAYKVFASTEHDHGFDPVRLYSDYSYDGDDDRETTVNLYTDRSIYRPGQTVHVAAIVHKTSRFIETQSVEGRRLTLRLRNANHKVVEEKTVATDKYGKASAEFILPTGQLNGRYTVETTGASQTFRVEEYKRPTYEVLFDDVKTDYRAGDTLAVTGQARSYAGVGVQGATVKYSVMRRVAYWWLSYSYYWSQGAYGHGYYDGEVARGELTTGSDGRFVVDVPLTVPGGTEKSTMFYQFVVEADVTDQAGESRTGSTAIPLGTRSEVLTCDLPEQILLDDEKPFTFHLYNAAGQEMEARNVSYRFDDGDWQNAKSNTPIQLQAMTSGRHTLEARYDGAPADEDPLKQTFTLFTLDDTKPCTDTKDWFYQSASQFAADGKPVTVQVGSSDENVHTVYSIFAGNQMIESGSFDQSDALWNRKFTYSEEYGNGLLLTFAWVKDGKVYSHQATIKRPLPDKQLNVRWETFRDRLTPGQKEEWKLVVTNTDGTPADAQLMAAMYDKSLDQLYRHHWAFAPYMYVPTPSTSWSFSSWGRLWASTSHDWESLAVKRMSFSHFDFLPYGMLNLPDLWDYDDEAPVVVGYAVAGGARRGRGNVMFNADAAPMMLEEHAVMKEVATEETADDADDAADDDETTADGQAVQMRENLNETAFFYPALTTDADGRIAIKFTLPESLTTWRFMGIATTQDMKNGYIEGEAVAQKEVMVQPNMPRFLRQGDKAQLATRIFNIADHSVSGTAMLRLLDPETQKVVLKQSKPFSVKAGETAVVTFEVELQSTQPLYICQVSASGKTFSDGEQHYLAVLPNQERVTVTVPFTQHEPGTTSINISKLFPSGTGSRKLTVEYTNNPAWLMVQALPSVGNPVEQNAIDQAAWLYSNLIARTLVAKSSNVKNVFNRWKQESPADGSLLSQLEKNQELKDILLQETPWVNDADRETEQKLRLADFFDENMMDNRIAEAAKKLDGLQNSNGSWSWWPGMPGSFYMTVSISEMLTRLNVMAGKQRQTAQMLDNAFRFMGKEMVEEVKEMKKWEKKHGKDYGFPSFKALQYLYICALDGRQLPDDVKKANDYLIGKMKKDIKNQTIYEKALSAIILSKLGETQRSREYAQSLKEYTVFTEEKGRYYDTPRAGYSWYDYKIPTEVMAIEALKLITPQDEQTVEEMLRWLLQEKRTQAWDTPINSVNAVYAFLFDNTRLLDAQEMSQLAIDGKPLELPKETAGIGYVKTAVEQPKGTRFTAKKTSDGTSWGALYAQFMQPVSEIENSGSGITIKREVVVLNNQSNQNNQSTLNNQNNQNTPITLKVGDRIRVRITIKSERDLDFVQVLDRRAACMEPVQQLSGYRNGAYCSPKDNSTNYYFDMLPKGQRVIETEYFIDRAGTYETGTCTVQCAYSPEYRATTKSVVLKVKE